MGEVKPSPKIFEHQGFPCPEDDFGHPRLVWAGQPGGTFLRQQKGHGAHTTARHSPSTGAYRDSASLVNLDPASTTCQPPTSARQESDSSLRKKGARARTSTRIAAVG